MSLSKWLEQAGEDANRIIVAVESHEAAQIRAAITGMNPDEVVLAACAIAQHLIEQEAANEVLRKQNATLENGNLYLFEERKRLAAKVREQREIIEQGASRRAA